MRSSTVRILLIEDERAISRFIQRGLREEGHVVDVAGDRESATQALCDNSYDLLLVDRMLPDGDGLSVVRDLRRDGDHTPAICVTARDRVDERVEGLYGGADDYLVKPFAFDELLARIAAVVRRTGTTGRIEIGDLIVDIEAHRAWRAGDELKLTAQEFTLLRY
ncbi:MAG: response regulator transcription factor, partial [Oligoflexia bacterium]|nr:response regulator transcription factor [Oligoflexia bacterium]